MPIEERNPNLNRLSAEFTDGAETGEFNTNEPLEQNRTGWDSNRYNQNPAGPLTDIGEGRSGQQSDPTQDYSQRTGDDYHVRTSWPSGSEHTADDNGPHFTNQYEDTDPDRNNTVAGGGSEFTGSDEGLRDRSFDRDDLGNDVNANDPWRNRSQGDSAMTGAGLVGTNDPGDDDDDTDDDIEVDDDEDELDGDLDLDDDDEESDIEDEVSNEYDDELGQQPRNSF